MGRSRLRHFVMRFGLDRVDQVGELDRVLNKEHRHVVSDKIEDAFVGVELDGKSAHVAGEVGRATRAGTVENRTNTGVSRVGSCRNPALVTFAIDS